MAMILELAKKHNPITNRDEDIFNPRVAVNTMFQGVNETSPEAIGSLSQCRDYQ